MENNVAINNNDPSMESSDNKIVEFPAEHSSSELPEGDYEATYSPKVIPMNKFITGFLILMLIMGGIYHFQYRQYAKAIEQQAYVISTAILLYEETLVYGYAGNIRMLTAVNNDGKVTGLVVLEAHETMGLGNEALTDHVFLSQFLNGEGEFSVATSGADAFSGATGEASADASEVDAITGATVTSKAIARCVNSAVAYVTGADVSSSATEWGG